MGKLSRKLYYMLRIFALVFNFYEFQRIKKTGIKHAFAELKTISFCLKIYPHGFTQAAFYVLAVYNVCVVSGL